MHASLYTNMACLLTFDPVDPHANTHKLYKQDYRLIDCLSSVVVESSLRLSSNWVQGKVASCEVRLPPFNDLIIDLVGIRWNRHVNCQIVAGTKQLPDGRDDWAVKGDLTTRTTDAAVKLARAPARLAVTIACSRGSCSKLIDASPWQCDSMQGIVSSCKACLQPRNELIIDFVCSRGQRDIIVFAGHLVEAGTKQFPNRRDDWAVEGDLAARTTVTAVKLARAPARLTTIIPCACSKLGNVASCWLCNVVQGKVATCEARLQPCKDCIIDFVCGGWWCSGVVWGGSGTKQFPDGRDDWAVKGDLATRATDAAVKLARAPARLAAGINATTQQAN